ncbi:hypothetical protein BaRGS_00032237, partial [Batillaria attramentaria]
MAVTWSRRVIWKNIKNLTWTNSARKPIWGAGKAGVMAKQRDECGKVVCGQGKSPTCKQHPSPEGEAVASRSSRFIADSAATESSPYLADGEIGGLALVLNEKKVSCPSSIKNGSGMTLIPLCGVAVEVHGTVAEVPRVFRWRWKSCHQPGPVGPRLLCQQLRNLTRLLFFLLMLLPRVLIARRVQLSVIPVLIHTSINKQDG